MSRFAEFVSIFKLYRQHHSPIYAARIAFGCVFRGLPF
jgi:hypothetical protein